MPRRARIAFPDLPHHVMQRGHRRNAVFFADADRVDYLATLRECRELLGVKVYGYCLMTNHVHLMIDPGERPGNLSLLMKRLAGRHSRRLNRIHRWSGSLWEGRFRCSPIDTDRYLMACGRYIDQNPVRARIVAHAEDFPWSSYRARAGLIHCDWLDPDPAIHGLASTAERRFEIYRQFAAIECPDDDLKLIRGALRRNQLTGKAEFAQALREEFGVDVSSRGPGRPPRKRSR